MREITVGLWIGCAVGAFFAFPEGVPTWMYGLAAFNCALQTARKV